MPGLKGEKGDPGGTGSPGYGGAQGDLGPRGPPVSELLPLVIFFEVKNSKRGLRLISNFQHLNLLILH